MWRFTIRLVAMVVLSLGSVASAGLGPNGLGPNGLGPNGLGPNGLGPNGLGPNGLGPNGLGPNGLGPNGLGPNGLGPNGLGPNGLDVNGLGPNGLGPNGLGPNGLIYLITPDGRTAQSTFSAWFEADSAGAAQYMRYFVRCAYDASTGIAYLDGTGKTWLWTGQYGFAMGSLKSKVREPLNPNIPTGAEVRSRMTVDEGRWVSSCLLAHVNLQGTHQYISLRGSPPNPEAAAAMQPGVNEQWIMGQARFGAFFADLFPAAPPRGAAGPALKYACTQRDVAGLELRKADVTIGRNCDVQNCKYRDASGAMQGVLTDHLGSCWLEDQPPLTWLSQYLHWQWAPSTQAWKDPFLDYDRIGVTYAPVVDGLTLPPQLHPIFVNGPTMVSASNSARYTPSAPLNGAYRHGMGSEYGADVARCAPRPEGSGLFPPSYCTADDSAFTVPLEYSANVASCGDQFQCLGTQATGIEFEELTQSYKLVGLREGQALDVGVKFTPVTPQYAAGDPATLAPAMDEPFTAIVRYSKERAGAANVWVSERDGSWRRATEQVGGPGPDVWPATGAGKWEWMQVYPAYLNFDRQGSSFLGRVCSSDQECALGLTCGHAEYSFICTKPAIPGNAIEQIPASCGGDPKLKVIDAFQGPLCVEQCVADSECGRGGACIEGQCVSPAVKVRLSGAGKGTSCTGAKVSRGDGEANTCSSFFIDWKKFRVTCLKRAEGAPACRGSLVYVVNSARDYGWRCVGGGAALNLCMAADAPDIDAVGFVPGRPWCMAAGATSFVGACK